MLTFKSNRKRFSLYYLEENEIYTQDMSAHCLFLDLNSKEIKKQKGRIHICSRSLIFESDVKDIPIYKYYFRYFAQKPVQQGYTKIQLKLSKIIEIQTNGPPSPYLTRESNRTFDVEIYPSGHENFKEVFDWINVLYDLSKSNNPGFDPEKDLDQIQSAKREVQRFDMSFISVNERPIIDKPPLMVRRIFPLISVSGFLYPTNKAIYFQPKYASSVDPIIKLEIDQISQLYKRRFELMNIGIEIFIQNQKDSLYFAFNNENERDQLYKALRDRVKSEILNKVDLEYSLEQWQKKEISNYEYLMRLNDASNRSFNDLSQYPIFPWIIKDYHSTSIDLQDESIYRDLSKPIGALNSKRLEEFRMRYKDMPRPKFMYGTHYSTPGYVIGYLVRKFPHYMLKLQSGRFDKPDRLFKSLKSDWKNVMNNNASVKELIPEFYQEDDSFLQNHQHLNLGERQNGKKVDDVKIPKWAVNTKHFLKINQEALESEYVSNNLHHWIDLIFGYKQRGPNSVEADNVFHPLTYEGAVDLEKITDPLERQAQRCQINEFGQCPKQLFKIPHPPRKVVKFQMKGGLQLPEDEFQQQSQQQQTINNLKQKLQNNMVIEENGEGDKQNNTSLWDNPNPKISIIHKANKQSINNIIELQKDKNKMISIGQDGSVKVIDLQSMQVKRSFKLCQFHLSCICPFNNNDELFAIGGWDSRIYIFNLNYGSTIGTIQEHTDTVSGIIYMKKRNQLFTASWDCTIKKFDVVEGGIDEDPQDFIDHENSITAIATNESEDILAFGDLEGQVCVYNIDSGEKIFDFELEGEKIVKIVIQDNNLVALGDKTIKFYEVSGTEISTFQVEKYNGQFNDVILDGKYIVAVTNKGHMPVYDLLQEKKIRHIFKDYKQSQNDIVEEDKQFTTIFVNSSSNVSIIGTQNGTLHIIQKE